jgi:predicted metal-dependent hydrolase
MDEEAHPLARRASAARTGSSTTNVAPERGSVEHAGTAIEYEVVRSARRRRTLELTVDGHGVRVSAPMRTPRHEIEEFVRGRTPWILKHRPTVRAPLAYATGETMPYQGVALPLFVTERPGRGVTVTRGLFDLLVTVPARYDAARRTRAIEIALAKWYAEHAQAAVEASVARWASITGRWPSRVLVRNQRQRWGSCSPDGTLRFNWRLIMLDPGLLDYVVVHELAHLEVPNHGPNFWRAVAALLPDHASRRRRMREAAANLPAL